MCHEYFGQTCGILPLEGETKVSTKGLKWDVGPGSCQFFASYLFLPSFHSLGNRSLDEDGQLTTILHVMKNCAVAYPTSMITSVSSSNHLLPEVEYIGIECDRNIIWTAEVKGGAD